MSNQELKEDSSPHINPAYGIPTPTLVSPPKVRIVGEKIYECLDLSNTFDFWRIPQKILMLVNQPVWTLLNDI